MEVVMRRRCEVVMRRRCEVVMRGRVLERQPRPREIERRGVRRVEPCGGCAGQAYRQPRAESGHGCFGRLVAGRTILHRQRVRQ